MKIKISILLMMMSLSLFAARQYGQIFWNQTAEANTKWNFILDVNKDNVFKKYGVYDLKTGEKTYLEEGSNFITAKNNLGFFVQSGNNGKYNYSNEVFQRNFFYEGDYLLGISRNYFDSTVATVKIEPTGQPLPGIIASIIVGTVFILFITKRKKTQQTTA